jgi:hypothetical protein
MESIERCDDDALLKSLIELGESCPKLLRPQLDQVIPKFKSYFILSEVLNIFSVFSSALCCLFESV